MKNSSHTKNSISLQYLLQAHCFPLLYTHTLTNPTSYGEGVSGGCATGFSIIRATIELPLDDINMRYDGCPTTEGNADGNSNGNFLQDGSTIVSAAAPSSQQTQDILMGDSHQYQPQQPAPESDPTANANTTANTFSHLSLMSRRLRCSNVRKTAKFSELDVVLINNQYLSTVAFPYDSPSASRRTGHCGIRYPPPPHTNISPR
jgi:hypothetical protein